MRIEPEISGVAIVLVGDFNPAIFTPAWFAYNDLLSPGAADSAEVRIVHKQVSSFSVDWLKLQVDSDRFQAETMQAPCVRVHDLVVRVFRDNLPHTPLRALGINRHVHFRVASLDERDRVGRSLAPLGPWGDWGHEIVDARHGGMVSLKMRRTGPGKRSSSDHVDVTVEPSNKVGAGMDGIYVGVNDHYAIDDSETKRSEAVVALLEENFGASLQYSDALVDQVMSLAT